MINVIHPGLILIKINHVIDLLDALNVIDIFRIEIISIMSYTSLNTGLKVSPILDLID